MGNVTTLRVVLALVLAACVIGVLNSTAEREEFTIRIAFLASQDDEDYIGAMAFKQSVEAALPGRVRVRIYPSGQYCGNERECIEGMQSGILEAHQTTLGGLASLYGAAQVLDLPYAFSDDDVAECVLDSRMIQAMGEEILASGLGLRLMAVGNTGGWRSFGMTQTRITSVRDLEGRRIRTLPSAQEQQMVRALGASPIALPWSEVYAALSAGLLDGVKNSVQDIAGMKLDDHVRFLFVDRHAYMASLWWISEPAWRQMPPELQAAVEVGFQELEAATRRAAKEREAPAMRQFLARGGTADVATPAQRAELKQATAGLRGWYAKTYGERWLHEFDAAVADCEARVALAAPGGTT